MQDRPAVLDPPRSTRSARARTCGFLALGGLIFSVVFAARLALVPADFYVERDDGIITLSHARNLVDYGFVGVNPSGERVEGFSAPLQFALYLVAYAATGLSYGTYTSR